MPPHRCLLTRRRSGRRREGATVSPRSMGAAARLPGIPGDGTSCPVQGVPVARGPAASPGEGVPASRGPESSPGKEAPAPRSPESSPGEGVPEPRGPASSSRARARQRARAEASTSASPTRAPGWAAVRANSTNAPHTSPSPTWAPPGASAPSLSPFSSTSRTTARVAPPFDCCAIRAPATRGPGAGGECGPYSCACQCRKVKVKRSGCLSAHPASSHQKARNAWAKSTPGLPCRSRKATSAR